jgi:hypothetical protein
MEQIRMKEKRSARFHFAVNEFQVFQSQIYPIDISACLIARLVVIDSTHQVRTSKHL